MLPPRPKGPGFRTVDMMNTFEICSLVIGSGILGLIIKGMFILGKMSQKLDTIEKDIPVIKLSLHSIDMRLTKLEGRFEERGYWESRIMRKTGTDQE